MNPRLGRPGGAKNNSFSRKIEPWTRRRPWRCSFHDHLLGSQKVLKPALMQCPTRTEVVTWCQREKSDFFSPMVEPTKLSPSLGGPGADIFQIWLFCPLLIANWLELLTWDMSLMCGFCQDWVLFLQIYDNIVQIWGFKKALMGTEALVGSTSCCKPSSSWSNPILRA